MIEYAAVKIYIYIFSSVNGMDVYLQGNIYILFLVYIYTFSGRKGMAAYP